MVALPAPASLMNRSSMEPRWASSPVVLIQVPDVRSAVVKPRVIERRRPVRRLRRDRVAVALTPVLGLVGLLAWGKVHPPTGGGSTGPAAVVSSSQAATGELLPVTQAIILSRVSLSFQPAVAEVEPSRSPALAVQPAGYLLPVDELVDDPEGFDHADARR